MENILSLKNTFYKYRSAVIDLLGLTVVYFTPAIVHLVNYPIYYLEPMRLFVIFAIAHTSKKNAYILALSLPIFSFLVSAHPSLIKTLLISGELALNVFLFYLIFFRSGKLLASIAGSLIISKAAYYLLKFALLSGGLLSGTLIATPIFVQIVMVIVFSVYISAFFKNEFEED